MHQFSLALFATHKKRLTQHIILHHEILQADEMQLGHLGLERGRSDVLSILFHLHLPYHTIHVWYIYLHLVELYGFHVGKYTSPWMVWDRNSVT